MSKIIYNGHTYGEIIDSSTPMIENQFEFDSVGTATVDSLYNCTGTATSGLDFITTKGGLIYVTGRLNIESFTRTGSNPGINVNLPSNVPTPTISIGYQIGFRSQSPREGIGINITAGSRVVRLITNETYLNCTNGTLTFICSGIFFC